MAENEEQGADGGAGGETIAALGNRLKALFEGKRWRELEAAIDLPTVWFLHAPKTVAEALALAAEVLGGANEVEVSLIRVLRSESGSAARGSYACCLAWLEPAGWKQQEVQFDLHLGFAQDGGGRWKLAYLGITPAAPELAQPPADRPEADRAAAFPGVFPGVLPGEPARPGAPPGSEPVMVYVPVFLPPETVQALLRGARREG